MKLNDKALLVQLSISQWNGRKFDKKATKEVANMHGINEFVGRYNKSLLPSQHLLKNVHQMSSTIRNEFYRNTLPWGIEGTYILPTSNYLSFMNEFRSRKADWESVVDQFVVEYPHLKQTAQQALGGLYNEDDYPSADDMRGRFKMDMAVFPVPATDFRCEINSSELSRIQQEVESRVQDAAKKAMTEVWQRLYDKVKHIADKLSDPNAIFRDSMLDNARELCELLPRLNFTDDPDLETMRQRVEKQLVHNPAESLRSDVSLRQQKASEANAILDAMGTFMGAN
jgi:hypothetical protein